MNSIVFLLLLIGSILVWLAFTPVTRAQEVKFEYPPEKPLSLAKLILTVKAIENTERWVIGPAGERSEYQITPQVWAMWSCMPFWWASLSRPECIEETLCVVKKHLAYIYGISKKEGYAHTPYMVGCIWKGGETRWRAYQLRAVDRDYAERFANYYGTLGH